MLSVFTFTLVGIQIFPLASSDKNRDQGIGYPLLALFAIVSVLDFSLVPRFIYFSWLTTYRNKGEEGFAKAPRGPIIGLSLGLGRDFIVGFSMLGMAPTALGFVAGIVENSLLISLPFHALALIHIFRFQIRLRPFVDRLSWNLAIAAAGQEPDIKEFFKVTAPIYSSYER